MTARLDTLLDDYYVARHSKDDERKAATRKAIEQAIDRRCPNCGYHPDDSPDRDLLHVIAAEEELL